MLLRHTIIGAFTATLIVATDAAGGIRTPAFKDNSFLANVVKFVEESRKAQAQIKSQNNGNQIIEPLRLVGVQSVAANIVPPIEQADQQSTVQQADFRVETGLFFDLNKGQYDDNEDCEEEEEEEEKKSKLKKLLFFLPSSVEMEARYGNSTTPVLVSPTILVNRMDSNRKDLYSSVPQQNGYEEKVIENSLGSVSVPKEPTESKSAKPTKSLPSADSSGRHTKTSNFNLDSSSININLPAPDLEQPIDSSNTSVNSQSRHSSHFTITTTRDWPPRNMLSKIHYPPYIPYRHHSLASLVAWNILGFVISVLSINW
ncbi:CIC11C00000004743 [Sungouiella intermedia]|uniref:CIC11C00000004743 n=1 Tax=Sungouiella intermedia TaxID=45354 RepID=A0A1L0DBF6_9ASCO|nr:CIC11C00000004743 [[Candida] intermedia]